MRLEFKMIISIFYLYYSKEIVVDNTVIKEQSVMVIILCRILLLWIHRSVDASSWRMPRHVAKIHF